MLTPTSRSNRYASWKCVRLAQQHGSVALLQIPVLARYVIPLELDAEPDRKHVRCARFSTRHDFSVLGTQESRCAGASAFHSFHREYNNSHCTFNLQFPIRPVCRVSAQPTRRGQRSYICKSRVPCTEYRVPGILSQVCSAWGVELGLNVSTPQPRHTPCSPNFRYPIIPSKVETVACWQHGYAPPVHIPGMSLTDALKMLPDE